MGARFPSESVGGLDRNQCPDWAGIGGRITPEYAGEASVSENLACTGDEFYKEYLLPDGQTLRLTREEFDDVVAVIGMLQRQEALGKS